MKQVIDEGNFNGYGPSVGFIESRQAVADYSQHQAFYSEVTPNDVILCSGEMS
jgi:aspartate/methionine/tyrosine aminotransferase